MCHIEMSFFGTFSSENFQQKAKKYGRLHYIMSRRELTRLELVQKVIEKRLKQRQAAEQLDLSERQIRRLCNAYNESIHKTTHYRLDY